MTNFLIIDNNGLATLGVYQKTLGQQPSNWIEIQNGASIGDTWDGTQWVIAPPDNVSTEQLRIERNRLLLESDFSQLSDVPHTDAEKALWLTYRQELRDLPDGYTPVPEPIYPTKP